MLLITRIFYILLGITFMFLVYSQVKKKRLAEKESIFWIIGAIAILILSTFPKIIIMLASIINVEYAPSLLFLIGIIFCLLLVFRLSVYVSILREQIKELAQHNAILEKRIHDLEKTNLKSIK